MSEDNKQEMNTLGLNDEEFMEQLGSGALDNNESELDVEVDDEENNSSEVDDSETDDKSTGETDDDSQDDTEIDKSKAEDSGDETSLDKDEDTESKDDTESHDDDKKTTDDKVDKSEADYKRIFQPFKANGSDMQVDNVEDVIKLMQMGANYTQKMQTLKPSLMLVKMLENNGLLDQDKLNNLIDLEKRDPKAIAKLLNDSGIDPLDVDKKGGDEYKPNDYSVSENSYNLDQAIDDIRSTDTFDKTIEIMGKKWDKSSRDIIAKNPDIVSVINTHVQNGVYDKVSNFVSRERALGRMSGMSDVEAYREGLNTLQSNGTLAEVGSKNEDKGDSTKNPIDKEIDAKKAEQAKKRKKAVAPTKKTSPKTSKAKVDFLDMPDDEFMKKYGQ